MDTKDMIRRLRTEKGLSQDELAEQVRAHMEALVPNLKHWAG